MTTRRDFLKNTLLTTAGIGLISPSGMALTNRFQVAPSDKIKIGLIGCKGMGWADLDNFLNNPECECIALCDVDESVLNERAKDVEKKTGKKPQNLYKDWRKVIDN